MSRLVAMKMNGSDTAPPFVVGVIAGVMIAAMDVEARTSSTRSERRDR